MTARTVCPAVYAGLIGGALIATPTSAYALNLQTLTHESLTGNPLTDGVLWVGAGMVAGATVGLCIHGCKIAYRNHADRLAIEREAALEQEKKAQYRPRHMKIATTEQELVHAGAHSAKHSSKDVSLEQLADNYVKAEQYKQKKSVRSQGVAYVLAQRLGFTTASFMEGIPVIERADGSVGDVGTSWWDVAVEDKRRQTDGFSEYLNIDDNWSATSMLDDPYAEPKPYEKKENTSEQYVAEIKPEEIKEVISQAVSEFDIDKKFEQHQAVIDQVHHEVFVEDTVLDGVSKEEIWQIALAAMDENINYDIASERIEVEDDDIFDFDQVIDFEDVIGSEESLDDPDGLEPKTQFIPFRAPVGHPEVVDTDSYIEYLIRTEEERINARRVNKKARKHLKVIEGGTSQFAVCNKSYYRNVREA